MPRRRRRRQKGEGPVWDAIKKGARNVYNFVKDNRLISRGANAIAPIVPGPYSGTVANVGKAAAVLDLGKEKKKRRGGRRKKK